MDAALVAIAARIADRYEIEREIGRGGMATVYVARDLRHARRVAVKVMRPEVAAFVGTERFLREVRVAAGLNHPHVLPLHDSGRVTLTPVELAPGSAHATDVLYYVMPYVEGESLRERLRREGALPLADAVRIADEVADALAAAHAQGVVHRDIKPENILLSGYRPGGGDHWHAVVADFGIARVLEQEGAALTATGMSVGTPAYMSPEQAAGEREVDSRADVYSLGCVLYEMLVGEPPFPGPTVPAIIARHLTAPVPSIRTVRPSVPAEVDALVARALGKIPADRFADALDFRRSLAASSGAADIPVADQAGTAGRPAPARVKSGWRPASRPAWSRGLLASAVAIAMVGGGYYAFSRARSRATVSLAAGTPAAPRERIAVLPLAIAGDTMRGYLADAWTDELISALSRVGGLRVLARSSVLGAMRPGRSSVDVARALSAGSVIEGTLYVRGDTMHYEIALVDAITGEQPWTGSYARTAADLAALPDSVALVVAMRLRGPGPTEPPRPERRRATPVNGAAYDAYLRGTYLVGRDPVPSRAVADSAIRYFERAIELDSSLAVAHSAIAGVYNVLFFNVAPNGEWEQHAYVEIEKALALDPNLAEAYQEKGSLMWTRARGFPHEAAAKLHRRAAELEPSYVSPHQSLGSIYMHVGLLDRALAEYDTALTLDPATSFVPIRIARIHWYQGKYEQALREYNALPNRGTSFIAERALVLNYLGRRTEALAGLDSALRMADRVQAYDLHAARAVVLASIGDRMAAREAIGRALAGGTDASHFHHASYSLAEAYALLDDRDNAIGFLRRTAADGMPCYPLFERDPHLQGLRGDPRFVEFMTDLRHRYDDLSRALR